ncbi:homeobox-leucine zipper protein ROC8-like [Carica papaya]|uniref:homeobox-leucine zipper protein ROC8-like n=1 Tax=Carica papaya TaxID=3649 RepID=UPI000B8CB5FD|nr:homeobox-leucine zipper protein ROC8-like [Carica papaya]
MDIAMGNSGTNNSSEEQRTSNRSDSEKRTHHRHNSSQIQHLELFFENCPHPDESQRRQLSRELGLDPKQVKFWFQNKRTQTRAQSERADNSALREENERIQCENLAIREALKNAICPACGGPPFGLEERQRSLQKLRMENAQLKEEHEKVSNFLAKYTGKPVSQFEEMSSPTRGKGPSNAFDSLPPSYSTQIGFPSVDNLDNFIQKYQENIGNNLSVNNRVIDHRQYFDPWLISDVEKAFMVETAASAMDELVRLLSVNEPLWIRSESSGSRAVIHRDTYEKIFPKVNGFKNMNSRIESSKESGMIIMNGSHLIEMIMDPVKWTDLFPTIVCKAEKLYEVQAGASGNKNSCLLLMYEQMHILSPLVPAREFIILRNCRQLEAGLWVMVDVSYDLKDHTRPRCWKLPSGCMIQDMANGCSKVIWIEHVEVDDKILTHQLYRDLLCSGSAYGAERWIVALQRICERLTFSKTENSCDSNHSSVMSNGMKSMLKLCHRMIKDFCARLCMSCDNKLDFPHMHDVNSSGVRVCVHEGIGPSQPNGTIVSATSSLWLPLPPLRVFNFFKDENMRNKWDILCEGNLVNVPFNPTENGMVMLQESFIDSLGGMVVYAPIDVPAMNVAITGDDINKSIPILPSGFVISTDGRQNNTGGASTSADTSLGMRRGGGSLITVVFQVVVSTKDLNMESVATVKNLISSTIQRIKDVLNCSNIE